MLVTGGQPTGGHALNSGYPDLADFVRTRVLAELGSDTRIVNLRPLALSGDSAVLLVELAGAPGAVVCKLGKAASSAIDLRRTARATSLARSAGVPVGAVLAVDTSSRHGPWQYLLAEHLAGVEWRRVRPLLAAEELAAAHQEIATMVLALQTVRLPTFGELDGAAEPVGGNLVEALRRRAELRIRDPGHRAMFHRVLDQESDLLAAEPGPATLTHDDLHSANVLFGRDRSGSWRLRGVLDWDKAWAGPAEADVARLAFWDDMTGPGFWQAYRAARPATAGEPRRALVYQLLWCLEYDSTTARHRADLAAVSAALAG